MSQMYCIILLQKLFFLMIVLRTTIAYSRKGKEIEKRNTKDCKTERIDCFRVEEYTEHSKIEL